LHKGDPAYDGNATAATGHHGHTGPGPAIGAAAGGAAGHHEGHTAAGTALGAAAGHHHANTHQTAQPGVAGNGAHTTGAAPVGGQTYPATGGAMNPGTGPVSAGEKKFIGKMEHAAGNILCSSTLKAKGIEKEREAEALKMQARELGAAERLESEAAAHRDRAVAGGAHPHHLGGGAGMMGNNPNVGGHHAGGAPVGDTYGGGIPPTGPAGGAPTTATFGSGGGLGPQGAGGLR